MNGEGMSLALNTLIYLRLYVRYFLYQAHPSFQPYKLYFPLPFAVSTVIFIPPFSGCLATYSDIKRSGELKLRSFVCVIGLRCSTVPLCLQLREETGYGLGEIEVSNIYWKEHYVSILE